MERDSLNELFDSFDNKTCLIVGDSMVDAYLWGDVTRISPEAPVPIVSINKRENRLGGAANVALNIISLGAKPILCGVIGDDPKGKVFQRLLREQNLSNEGIFIDPTRKTTSKTRIISDSNHMLRVDEESDEEVNHEIEAKIIEYIQSVCDQKLVDVIILEDYNKGLLTENVIRKTIEAAQKNNIPTTVDPKKSNFFSYSGATLFKPNLKEFVEGNKLDFENFDLNVLFSEGEKFKSKTGVAKLMVTLSENGVMICGENGNHHTKAEFRNIADVSGAGDTVIAVASLALACNLDDELVIKLSNLAGGLVCEEVGVVPIDKELLKQEATKTLVP